MALEPVKLDDLTWNEMILSIRRRIAAASDGKWTLHSAVDPGVTLLELFAWLLEQRVYWMDQAPDSFVRAALALIGEKMQPARASSTVLRFPPQEFWDVPEMTQMRVLNAQPSLVFSTEHDVTLLPIEKIGLEIGGVDRTADLESGRVIRLFPSSNKEAQIKIVLWLSKPVPALTTGRQLSLLLKLRDSSNIQRRWFPNPEDAERSSEESTWWEKISRQLDLRPAAGVKPQWSPGALTNVPPPANVSWWYRSASGPAPVRFASVKDGTGGFRRSGIVRFAIPEQWQPDGAAGSGTGWIPYSLLIRVKNSTFSSPPRLEQIVPNAAIARHLFETEEFSFKPKPEWLPLPGNQIALEELNSIGPEKDFRPLEPTIRVKIEEKGETGTQWHDWKPEEDLTFSAPDDRHFRVDRKHGLLIFGDGITGRIPVLSKTGNANLKVRYFAGGGLVGNIGSNLEWEGVKDGDLQARNIVPSDGGAESETIPEARQRAAASLKTATRAITRDDHEEIALTTPGVGIRRAYAAVGFHPGHPCIKVPGAVTLFVLPDVPRETVDDDWVEDAFVAAPLADPGALAAIRDRLEKARLVGSEIFVRNPRYRPVALDVSVEDSNSDPLRLRKTLHDRLEHFLDPLVGGDTALGWPFGEPLRPSVLLRESQLALEETGTVTSVAIRLLDSDQPPESCFDVAIGSHELVTLSEVTVQLSQIVEVRSGKGGLR